MAKLPPLLRVYAAEQLVIDLSHPSVVSLKPGFLETCCRVLLNGMLLFLTATDPLPDSLNQQKAPSRMKGLFSL